jgi:hypothetical protein
VETIKTYAGQDVGTSQCLVTLEVFIGDVDNTTSDDDSTIDTSDAVTAINGLIASLERREAEIERLRTALEDTAYPLGEIDGLMVQIERLRAERHAANQLAADNLERAKRAEAALKYIDAQSIATTDPAYVAVPARILADAVQSLEQKAGGKNAD